MSLYCIISFSLLIVLLSSIDTVMMPSHPGHEAMAKSTTALYYNAQQVTNSSKVNTSAQNLIGNCNSYNYDNPSSISIETDRGHYLTGDTMSVYVYTLDNIGCQVITRANIEFKIIRSSQFTEDHIQGINKYRPWCY